MSRTKVPETSLRKPSEDPCSSGWWRIVGNGVADRTELYYLYYKALFRQKNLMETYWKWNGNAVACSLAL